MKIVEICKASPIGDPVEDVMIHICDTGLIGSQQTLEQWASHCEAEAQKTFEALKALPGSVIDHLIIKLLQQQASLFQVPYQTPAAIEACQSMIESFDLAVGGESPLSEVQKGIVRGFFVGAESKARKFAE